MGRSSMAFSGAVPMAVVALTLLLAAQLAAAATPPPRKPPPPAKRPPPPQATSRPPPPRVTSRPPPAQVASSPPPTVSSIPPPTVSSSPPPTVSSSPPSTVSSSPPPSPPPSSPPPSPPPVKSPSPVVKRPPPPVIKKPPPPVVKRPPPPVKSSPPSPPTTAKSPPLSTSPTSPPPPSTPPSLPLPSPSPPPPSPPPVSGAKFPPPVVAAKPPPPDVKRHPPPSKSPPPLPKSPPLAKKPPPAKSSTPPSSPPSRPPPSPPPRPPLSPPTSPPSPALASPPPVSQTPPMPTPAAAPPIESDCAFSAAGSGSNVGTCAMGFAAGVTGGSTPYVVTTDEDMEANAPPGTLRFGTFFPGNYITFSRDMDIYLKPASLPVNSNVTIDGRGFKIRIFLSFNATANAGSLLYLFGSSNVIILNVEVVGVPETQHLVYLQTARKVWVDHCKFSNSQFGTVNLFFGSTDVTISNSIIVGSSQVRFSFQFGHSDDVTQTLGIDGVSNDAGRRVTLYRNLLENHYGGAPLARYGVVHVVNNLYRNWGNYSIHGRRNATLLSEANVYVPNLIAKEITQYTGNERPTDRGWDNTSSLLTSNDWLSNGATFHVQTYQGATYTPPYSIPIAPAGPTLQDLVLANAGPKFPVKMPPPPPSPPVPPPPPTPPPPTDCVFTVEGTSDPTVCVQGQGASTVGGKLGTPLVVSIPDWADAVGSLYKVIFTPSYVTFSQSMTIDTQTSRLYFKDGTTLDGRGKNITIITDYLDVTNGGYNKDLIFININWVFKTSLQSYGVYISNGASNLWFEHCSFTVLDSNVRTVGITGLSTSISLTNNRFTSPGAPIVIGGSDSVTQDEVIKVTLFRNVFAGGQYLIQARYATVDAINNYFTNWTLSAVAPRFKAKFYSRANIYELPAASGASTAVDKDQVAADQGYIASTVSEGDWLVGGVTFFTSQAALVSLPAYLSTLDIRPADDVLKSFLLSNAGPNVPAL